MNLKKKLRKKNPTSGAGPNLKIRMLLQMVKLLEVSSLLFVKKPFQKSTLKTSYGNLKWSFCRVM